MRLRRVRKRYGRDDDVLAGIDLDLAPGTPVIIHGGNGCGKSTLLRIVAGCSTPTSGSIVGRPRTVGYLPDRFPARLRLPVDTYLRHLAAVHRAPARDAAGRSDRLLAELGFSAGSGTPMAQLSKGNAQKVGLAQALSCDAGLLVLDEPWSGLDADAGTALGALIERAATDGAAVLIVDHAGRGGELTGVRRLRLHAGVLHPGPAPPRAAATVRIELRCPAHPDAVLRELPAVLEARQTSRRLVVRVLAEDGDALLTAALARGCSVVELHRESRPGR